MDPISQQLMMGAAGSGGEKIYVEDVFSTWLYTGNGSTQTITNGIDLAGKGGLVWQKARDFSIGSHYLIDTARGSDKVVFSDLTSPQATTSNVITSFNSNGFSLGDDSSLGYVNYQTGKLCASWTFRKAAKFFDVVTYTGNGTTQNVAHSLGSKPGCIIVKRTNASENWAVWHRGNGSTFYSRFSLNTTGGAVGWSDVATSTTFAAHDIAGASNSPVSVNANGATYVAYLFAHDAGGFGDSGNESIISCGLVTANGSGQLPEVNLGWEPQWILRKRIDVSVNWEIVDNMRGMPPGNGMNSAARLFPNTSGAEDSGFPAFGPTATGFTDGTGFNPNEKIIYIAIRRGPMKTPTDATTVFNAQTYTGNGSTSRNITAGFPVDAFINANPDRTWNGPNYWFSRITNTSLQTSSTGAESGITDLSFTASNANTGINLTSTSFNGNTKVFVNYHFRRAPGFFDVVAYTGGASAISVSHNLGVQPELVICKRRNAAQFWIAGVTSLINGAYAVNFSSANAFFDAGAGFLGNDSTKLAPTSSTLSFGSAASCNGSGGIFIAYLFASCPGVSKVGSYTGTGTTLNVDCGFTNGARFVLIKRTDSTGDWYVWDTARGIVSGNDPYLLLNSTAAEVTNTDFIDPLSSGFQISSTAPAAINANGGSFIFLAVA